MIFVSRPGNPVHGGKFHAESEIQVQNAKMFHAAAKIEENRRSRFVFNSFILFSDCLLIILYRVQYWRVEGGGRGGRRGRRGGGQGGAGEEEDDGKAQAWWGEGLDSQHCPLYKKHKTTGT